MTTEEQHHVELIRGISSEYQAILESSSQSIYLYLDDMHKVCNQKFASLLGYASPGEWAQAEGPFTQLFVDAGSQAALVEAYTSAMNRKAASSLQVTWRKKSGGSVATGVILVPVAYQGHLFALHFID